MDDAALDHHLGLSRDDGLRPALCHRCAGGQPRQDGRAGGRRLVVQHDAQRPGHCGRAPAADQDGDHERRPAADGPRLAKALLRRPPRRHRQRQPRLRRSRQGLRHRGPLLQHPRRPARHRPEVCRRQGPRARRVWRGARHLPSDGRAGQGLGRDVPAGRAVTRAGGDSRHGGRRAELSGASRARKGGGWGWAGRLGGPGGGWKGPFWRRAHAASTHTHI
mmetsp:Transcript_38970/g.102156  ORF Transcript_38970/g.102156 Transcript_38970/m.102156 type:complete len:220 (-) Transcript_38970:300-959(-)